MDTTVHGVFDVKQTFLSLPSVTGIVVSVSFETQTRHGLKNVSPELLYLTQSK